MKRRTILLSGATGLLGSVLVREWADRHRLVALSHHLQIDWPCVTALSADLAVPVEIEQIILESMPDVVVHAAAWTDVDACERNPERAMAINAVASGRIAAAAARVGAACIYISTDSVFDGSRGSYSEMDPAHPVNVYSASKLAGEGAVLSRHPSALVVRVSLEGWRPAGRPGFVQWVVEGLSRRDRLTVCTDWIRSVTFASNLPAVLDEMWSKGLAGIYHVAPSQPLSNFELAMMTADVFGLDSSGLVPISGDSLKLSARRPKNTSLDNRKMSGVIHSKLWEIADGLGALKAERDSGALDQMRRAIVEKRHGAVHHAR
ncbi:MAG TPA: SDR family oxidoreductase [Gemmatimonadaceae bacterium]